jgi:hypothetical protein
MLLTPCWQQAFDRKGTGKLAGFRVLLKDNSHDNTDHHSDLRHQAICLANCSFAGAPAPSRQSLPRGGDRTPRASRRARRPAQARRPPAPGSRDDPLRDREQARRIGTDPRANAAARLALTGGWSEPPVRTFWQILRTQERAISRKTIAQGRPGVPAHLAVTRVHFCARSRVLRAPGFPCALFAFEGIADRITPGASRRENAMVCLAGWVERSETHQRAAIPPLMGIASLYPSCGSSCLTFESEIVPTSLRGAIATKQSILSL